MVRNRLLKRYFVLAVVALVIIDAWPAQTSVLFLKKPVAQLMDIVGLRQGSWAMFTPNPVINNRWISADMHTKDGRVIHWDSPLWSRASTWDKFVQFRRINYYNRIHQTWCMAGRYDFLDYVGRTSGEELESIQLHLNRMDLIMPADGSLPLREETEWRLISEPWIGNTDTR